MDRRRGETGCLMRYEYPRGTHGVLQADYSAEFEAPVDVSAGAVLIPDIERRDLTFGWIWCTAEDGSGGFVPMAWIDRGSEPWRIIRDYSARELTAKCAERVLLLYAESGWVWARNANGGEGWIPDWLMVTDKPK